MREINKIIFIDFTSPEVPSGLNQCVILMVSVLSYNILAIILLIRITDSNETEDSTATFCYIYIKLPYFLGPREGGKLRPWPLIALPLTLIGPGGRGGGIMAPQL